MSETGRGNSRRPRPVGVGTGWDGDSFMWFCTRCEVRQNGYVTREAAAAVAKEHVCEVPDVL